MMTFSIIIPVYNVERHLTKCVHSVLSQDYKSFEIILVNDGSPDNCPQICDDLAKNNKQVKVVHKKNGGLSSARNVGLDHAKGDYIIFLDSDDRWIDASGLTSLTNIIEQYTPDTILFGVEDFDSNTGVSIISRHYKNETYLNSLSVNQLIDALIVSGQFPGSAWMLATRRAFLNSLNLSFKEGVTAEDFDWLIKIFDNAQQIKVVSNIIYQYQYTSEGSITSKPRISGIYGIHNAISNWLRIKDTQNQSLTNYLGRVYLQSLINYAGLTKKERKEAFQIVKSDAKILMVSSSVIMQGIYLSTKLFGIGIIANLIRMVYNRRKCRLQATSNK